MAAVHFWLVALAVVLVPMAACDEAQASPYEDLLALIPDTSETRSYVLINDYALMRELFDIPSPGPGADEKEMEEYYRYAPPPWREGDPVPNALGATAFLSDGYSRWRFQLSGQHRRYLGFDIRNEDRTMVAGATPRQIEVLRGRFDPEAFDRALSTCLGECTPPDLQDKYQGVTFYSWGEDYEADLTNIFGAPALDQLGRGGRIAIQGRYVFRTLGTGEMTSTIDASQRNRSSLADREDYRLLAQGLSELGAYAVFLTDQSQGFEEVLQALCEGLGKTFGERDCVRIGDQLQEREPMLRRYQMLATGVGKDKEGAYTALVLVHADEASARDNAVLLRSRIAEGNSLRFHGLSWADFFDTSRVEVFIEDRVLLAKLRPTEGRRPVWIEWLFQQDPLLLHEP